MAEASNFSAKTQRSVEVMVQYEKDALFIHPSEHSSLALTSSPLDGTNFLAWSHAVRVDLMVTSWIWNSMSKNILESFMFCATLRELWLAVQARYGQSNGPMLYRLQREISSISQNDLTLKAYLTKKITMPSDPLTNYANYAQFDGEFADITPHKEKFHRRALKCILIGKLTILMFSPANAPQMIETQSVDTEITPLRRAKKLFGAMQHIEWQDAMKTELDVLEHNCTWKLTPLPEGKRPIGCKWVFKTKLRVDGSVEKYKPAL
ncbi:UNVERIFIED_CONTAM: putative mitochondrial protein [Sesamum calycinum]|uniref:Mitochondrial protein n=1 Tax=Sesamum calycinum TaxID=2727403 RepID=A0AAW2Q2Y3_9LAMI